MTVYPNESAPASAPAPDATAPLAHAALRTVRELGWFVHPLGVRAKAPLTEHGVKDASNDEAQVRAWWRRRPQANIGLSCGASGLVVLDFDVAKEGYAGAALLERLQREAPTVISRTGSGGVHLFYKMPKGIAIGCNRGRLPRGVDVKGLGGTVVLPPSLHPNGECYRWEEGWNPWEYTSEPLPAWVVDLVRRESPTGVEEAPPLVPTIADVVGDAARAERALEALAPWRCDDYPAWIEVGMALRELGAAGLSLWECWSRRSKRYQAGVCEAKWQTFAPGGGIGLGSLFHWAAEDRGRESRGESSGKSGDPAPELTNPPAPHSGQPDAAATPLAGAGEKKPTPKRAELLYAMARDEIELFLSLEGAAYAFVRIEGVRACLQVISKEFERWLTACSRQRLRYHPSAQTRADVQAMLEWDARTEQRPVWVRVAGDEQTIYLDLGTPTWEAVEVDATGWRIVKEPPVAFRRSRSTGVLPRPVPSAEPWRLQRYLNINPEDWPLVAAWAVAALRPQGPYPILALVGEQGTAKSTTLRVLKNLIDPQRAGLRGQPADIRDLMVGAANSWLLAYDNLSVIHGEVSDALCRIATGGGYAKRLLFTDSEELLIDVMRPIALNGIGDVVTRPDLMERALLIVPPVIAEEKRRDEASFWREFEQERPVLLGALLGALSTALRRWPQVKLERSPRMADFARVAVAAEVALCPHGEARFLTLYARNRAEATESVIESSPIGEALRLLAEQKGHWEGSATDLLAELEELAGDSVKRTKGWPTVPNRLKALVERLAPSLRRVGIEISYLRQRTRSKIIIDQARKEVS